MVEDMPCPGGEIGTAASAPVWRKGLKLAFAAYGLVTFSHFGIALAQETPLPPPRPALLSPPPPAVAPPLAPPLPAGVDPMVTNFSKDMPQELPTASRAQMHKCGAEWQKMKASGAATDKTWLAFAQTCLAQTQSH
ncbi:MAG TPA: hypothetical protein VL492_12610 [Methylovirgula sp.]|jgi:hypothetical protein|nr:hypothetical protein [Methylovirgula sp.]